MTLENESGAGSNPGTGRVHSVHTSPVTPLLPRSSIGPRGKVLRAAGLGCSIATSLQQWDDRMVNKREDTRKHGRTCRITGAATLTYSDVDKEVWAVLGWVSAPNMPAHPGTPNLPPKPQENLFPALHSLLLHWHCAFSLVAGCVVFERGSITRIHKNLWGDFFLVLLHLFLLSSYSC